MNQRIRVLVVVGVLVFGVGVGSARGQTDFSKFPLTKAAPADVFIAVAGKANQERKFLDDYWSEVSRAFRDSGVMGDLWELISDRIPDEELDKVEDIKEQFSTVCGKVAWGELFSTEMIYTARLVPLTGPGSPYEGLVIGRMKSQKLAAENCESLKAILQEIAKLVEAEQGEEALAFGEREVEGAKFTTFGPKMMPNMVSLGCKDDLIIIGLFNRTLLDDAMALLKGSSKKPGLIETDRFKKAFKGLPAAEDVVVFWDAAKTFQGINEMIGAIEGASKGPGAAGKKTESAAEKGTKKTEKQAVGKAKKGEKDGADEEEDEGEDEGRDARGATANEEEMALKAVKKLLSDFAMFDYMAMVEWTDGYQVLSEEITSLVPGAKKNPLCEIVIGGAPVEKFEKYVPKEATDFWCSSGIDFRKLYRYITGFVADLSPDGKSGVAEFEGAVEKELGLNIEKDLLGLFDGNIMTATMGSDWIIMLKVTNEKKASESMFGLIETINEKLGKENALVLTDVEVAEGKKFVQMSHPMMLMMGGLRPPVLGFAEGHMILATSGDAVTKCLDTAKGEHPNITKSKRWTKEALVPKAGVLDSISFKDESNTGAKLQAVLGGLTMAMGMMGMVAQDMPPEVRSFITGLTPILTKLGPVAGKLDFYQSSASYSTFDGNAWHARNVQNYKEPKAKSEVEDEESGPAEKKDTAEKKVGEKDKKESPAKKEDAGHKRTTKTKEKAE
jgi:hypothetical protein